MLRALTAVACLVAAVAFSAERPLYVSRPLTPDDLKDRTLRELTLMRNWLYAKRGNEFRRRWLREFFTTQAWYQPDQRSFLNEEWRTNLPEEESTLDDRNASAIADAESALTTEQLMAMRDAVRARLKVSKTPDANDLLELRLLSIRLGAWAGEGDAPADLTPLENPARLDTLLRMKDLDDLSPRDLKLLRNTIFARRGRTFETPLVKGHFKTVAWYRPDPKYSDKRLTDIDKKNVKLIQSLEKDLKREAEPNFMLGA
jgi:hypothetical protein